MYKGKRIRRKRRRYMARGELVTLIMCHMAIVLGIATIALVVQMERADRRVEQSVTTTKVGRIQPSHGPRTGTQKMTTTWPR